MIVDRRVAFVGTLNLDPRSIRLNTEVGVVIDSPVEIRLPVSSFIARMYLPNIATLPTDVFVPPMAWYGVRTTNVSSGIRRPSEASPSRKVFSRPNSSR